MMHVRDVQQRFIATISFVAENRLCNAQVSCLRDHQERWPPLVDAESTLGLLILLP